MWQWLTGASDSVLGGGYRLPWRPWSTARGAAVTPEAEQDKVLVVLFERVGTYTVCKQRIADGLGSELRGRVVEELGNEEQRRLHTHLGLALTNCHLQEHDRQLAEPYRSASEMTGDDFALYTQFLLAVEETMVSQLGHERWQRSVEQMVSTLTGRMAETNADLRGLGVVAAEARDAQQELLEGQGAAVAQQGRLHALVQGTADAGEAHFARLHDAAVQAAQLTMVAAQAAEQQMALIRGQAEMEQMLSVAAAASADIAEMVGAQHTLLLDVREQSDSIIGAWGPALEAVRAASSKVGFFEGLHTALFYLLWFLALQLVPRVLKPPHLADAAYLALVLAAAVECYAPLDPEVVERTRVSLCAATAVAFLVAAVVKVYGMRPIAVADANASVLVCAADRAGETAFVRALLADIKRGTIPPIDVDKCPALLALLAEAPPGYTRDEDDGELVACK